MKKLLALMLAFLMTLPLAGCADKKDITYYLTKTHRLQETGDVNLTERTYDENWNPLLDYVTLNGSFASQVEYEYSEDFSIQTVRSASAIYEPENLHIIRTFDEKGQILTAETYKDERHISTGEYTYDELGNTVQSVVTYPNPDPEAVLVITVQRSFDDAGKLVRVIEDTGYLCTLQEYSYDKKGRLIREEHYQNDELRYFCEYSWKGNTASGIRYHADGTHLLSMRLEYDDAENLLVSEVTYPDGRLQSRTSYEYAGTDGSISSGIPE